MSILLSTRTQQEAVVCENLVVCEDRANRWLALRSFSCEYATELWFGLTSSPDAGHNVSDSFRILAASSRIVIASAKCPRSTRATPMLFRAMAIRFKIMLERRGKVQKLLLLASSRAVQQLRLFLKVWKDYDLDRSMERLSHHITPYIQICM